MKIPASVLDTLEKELASLSHGSVSLEIVVHDNIAKYRVIKTTSIIPGKNFSGKTPPPGQVSETA